MAVFLIDANILMHAEKVTPPSVFVSLWEWFRCNDLGVKSILAVYDEISPENSWLRTWARDRKQEGFFISNNTARIKGHGDAVTDHVMNNYQDTANRDKFLGGADTWLISTAIEHQCGIITMEKPAPTGNQNRPPKIPDVAHEFGIRCSKLNVFFQNHNVTF